MVGAVPRIASTGNRPYGEPPVPGTASTGNRPYREPPVLGTARTDEQRMENTPSLPFILHLPFAGTGDSRVARTTRHSLLATHCDC